MQKLKMTDWKLEREISRRDCPMNVLINLVEFQLKQKL